MIDNIIAGYLRANKRLVVPELGSFIRKEGGETVFVEFLKKDDGALTALLAKEYGLQPEEAAEAVAGYVEGVRRTVAASGRYVVDGVGVLGTDANGLLELEGTVAPAEPDNRPQMVVEEIITVVETSPEAETEVEAEPEPEVVWRQETVVVVEPEPEPEPVRVAEPMYEPEPVCVEPEPENTNKNVEEKKAFTLNDLYAIPEEQQVAEQNDFWLGSEKPRHEQQPIRDWAAELAAQPEKCEPALKQEPRVVRPPHIRRPAKRAKSRIDIVMIIAVAAAVFAIASLFIFTRNGKVVPKPTSPQEIVDTIGIPMEMEQADETQM